MPTACRFLKEHLSEAHWLNATATKGATYNVDSAQIFPSILTGIYTSQLSSLIKNSLLLVLERLWSVSKRSLKTAWQKWHERMSAYSYDTRTLGSNGPISQTDKNFVPNVIFPTIRPALELIMRVTWLTEAQQVSN